MFTNTLVVAAALLGAAAPAQADGNTTIQSMPKVDTEAATAWQLYSFAQSWQPQFCHGQSYPGCSSPNAFWKSSFTIHGLWPDVTSGKYPSDCSNEAFSFSKVTAAVPLATLQKYWPNVKSTTGSSSYSSFWSHEWEKHGTCSGLDQATYFKTAVSLLVNDPTPSIIGAKYGQSVSAADLRSAYGGADQVVLQCSGKYLKQVLTCWIKGSGSVPTARRACPSNLLGEGSCPDSITISAF
jgi:ribonuclease T2